jgi:hypothetical protein
MQDEANGYNRSMRYTWNNTDVYAKQNDIQAQRSISGQLPDWLNPKTWNAAPTFVV